MRPGGANDMAASAMSRAVRQLCRAVLLPDGGGLSDGQLLGCFVARRDEAAFEALVRRHGPMVLGVCRRVLGNLHDAEDAFQATFLVLARKAAALGRRELVGNYLYGVAYRTALKARAANVRRRGREKQVKDMPHPEVGPEGVWRELEPLLDRELERLPEKYRVPVVLCELEGRPRREVARQLGVPEGTLSSRLATARRLLAARLARRGVTLSAGAVAAALAGNAARACVPAAWVASTVRAASGVVPARAAALMEGVLKTMFLSKLKIVTAVLLTAALAGVGFGVFPHSTVAAPEKAEKPKKPGGKPTGLAEYMQAQPWVLTRVDSRSRFIALQLPGQALLTIPFRGKHTLDEIAAEEIRDLKTIIRSNEGIPEGRLLLPNFTVSSEAEVFLDGKEATLKDLRRGLRVRLRMAADKPVITRIDATSPEVLVLKATDVEKNTITVSVGGRELTLPLTVDARIRIGRKKEPQFTDLKPGMRVDLTLVTADDKVAVQAVTAGK